MIETVVVLVVVAFIYVGIRKGLAKRKERDQTPDPTARTTDPLRDDDDDKLHKRYL